jgi:uncharacterized protein
MPENARMIPRLIDSILHIRLGQMPCVALIGPRQIGKTTTAKSIASALGDKAAYLDLERADHRARVREPQEYFAMNRNKLVVLDEVQWLPGLFAELRSEIDLRRETGQTVGQFLVLGSAALPLIRQSSESLAGRIAYLEMQPILAQEYAGKDQSLDHLWLRGGFPSSLLAKTEAASQVWRRAFLRTYLERDIPQFGIRIPAEKLRRFWTMLAHSHSQLLNVTTLAQSLDVGWDAATHYLDLFCDLMLVRKLLPWSNNAGKRLVKSPKIYLRDSGLLHTLLGIETFDQLLGHPIAGASWEGMVLESLIAAAPEGTQPYFYRTAAGAEIDLVLDLPGGRKWAIEIKKSAAPKLSKGFHVACADLKADAAIVVHKGEESFPYSSTIMALTIRDACKRLQML